MNDPIAIVGMACRFPGAPDYREFWSNLCEGRESVVRVSHQELALAGVDEETLRDPMFVPAGGCLDNPLGFDGTFFGYSPAEGAAIDPQHRVFLETCLHALEDGGIDPQRFDGRISIHAGASRNTYERQYSQGALSPTQRELGNEKDHLATRVAYKLGLTGSAVTVQTACSTSLVAIHYACAELLSGNAAAALAGGVSLRFPHAAGYLHEPGGIASRDGHCRPFDAAADGTVRGSGVGVVVLRRLRDALGAGDPIHAVILGTAVNNDGAVKAGYSAPGVRGQEEVIVAARQRAGVRPDAIGYVEAHGTATPLGDPIEVRALARAFDLDGDRGEVRLGAVKGNVGHLDAAAGVAGLIKVALIAKHGLLPPTLHYEAPNPELRLEETPFVVQRELSAWTGPSPRTAAVSSFGMGGTNAHAVLCEPPSEPAAQHRPLRSQLVLVTSRSEEGAQGTASNLAEHCEGARPNLDDIAWTTQVGRPHRSFRSARVCQPTSLLADLRKLSEATPRKALEDPRVALLFPGQGVGSNGMLGESYRRWPALKEDVDRCCGILGGGTGEAVLAALTSRCGVDAAWWTDTANVQPTLFVAEHALALFLGRLGVKASGCWVGHSLGELVGALASGVFSERSALEFVVERGRLMASVPSGGMAAVAAAVDEVRDWLPPDLDVAAVNAPDRTVVSGPESSLASFVAAAESRRVSCRKLAVESAFHSRLMEDAVEGVEKAAAAAGLRRPEHPFLSTLSGGWVDEEAAMPSYWARQIRDPVRFGQAIEQIGGRANVFVEVGPGSTLTGLARRTLRGDNVAFVSALSSSGDDADALLNAIGQLWSWGVEVDWRQLSGEGRRVHLPGNRFVRVQHVPAPAAKRSQGPGSIYTPLWQALTPLSGEPTESDRFVLVGAPDGIREATATVLREGGHRVDLVKPGPSAELPAGGQEAGRIVYLASAEKGRHKTAGFDELLDLAHAVSRQRFGVRSLDVVGRHIHCLESSDAPRPEAALIRGLTLVLPQEMPGLGCRLIEVADDPFDPHALVRELLCRNGPPEVALRGGNRWMRRFVPLGESGAGGLRKGGRYAVLGADGRIGRVLVPHLRERWQAQVAAVARSGGESDEGSTSLRFASDIGRPGAVRDVLLRVHQRLGGIDAVFHLAGVTVGPSLREIRDLDRDAAAEQWPAKVRGTRELAAMAAELDVPLCVAFSSLASVLGGVELGAYAAANAFQDAIAQTAGRTRPGCWLTIGWDAWAFEGDRALPGFGSALRRSALSPEAGMRAFEKAVTLAGAYPYLAVGQDVHERMGRWLGDRAPGGGAVRAEARSSANGDGRADVALDAIATVLGVQGIDPADSFSDLGGDSLQAIQLVGEIFDRLGVEVGVRTIFETANVGEFCEHVAGLGEPQRPAPGP